LAKLGIDAPYGKLLPMIRSLAIKYFNHLRIFWYCFWRMIGFSSRYGGAVRRHAIFGQ
jgi:hypothetical protein